MPYIQYGIERGEPCMQSVIFLIIACTERIWDEFKAERTREASAGPNARQKCNFFFLFSANASKLVLKCCRHSCTAHSWFHVLRFGIPFPSRCHLMGGGECQVSIISLMTTVRPRRDTEDRAKKLCSGLVLNQGYLPLQVALELRLTRTGWAGQYSFLFCFFFFLANSSL